MRFFSFVPVSTLGGSELSPQDKFLARMEAGRGGPENPGRLLAVVGVVSLVLWLMRKI